MVRLGECGYVFAQQPQTPRGRDLRLLDVVPDGVHRARAAAAGGGHFSRQVHRGGSVAGWEDLEALLEGRPPAPKQRELIGTSSEMIFPRFRRKGLWNRKAKRNGKNDKQVRASLRPRVQTKRRGLGHGWPGDHRGGPQFGRLALVADAMGQLLTVSAALDALTVTAERRRLLP